MFYYSYIICLIFFKKKYFFLNLILKVNSVVYYWQ